MAQKDKINEAKLVITFLDHRYQEFSSDSDLFIVSINIYFNIYIYIILWPSHPTTCHTHKVMTNC